MALLDRSALASDGFVKLGARDKVKLSWTVAGVDEITLAAYALDLRTLFLRDGGMDAILDLKVAGIAPAWQGARAVKRSPYPKATETTLPLSGPGAWLVLAEAGGHREAVLVWRSELDLDVVDAGDLRRVTVRRGDRPAEGVEIRSPGAELVATRTDARGVALVPAFAPVLAFDGAHADFTLPGEAQRASGVATDELERRLREEVRRLREQTRQQFAFIGQLGPEGVLVAEL